MTSQSFPLGGYAKGIPSEGRKQLIYNKYPNKSVGYFNSIRKKKPIKNDHQI